MNILSKSVLLTLSLLGSGGLAHQAYGLASPTPQSQGTKAVQGAAAATPVIFQLLMNGRQRCGYDDKRVSVLESALGGQASDCNWNSTNPADVYAPTYIYDIPIVFHVIQHTNGDGDLSPATIQDQIDVLNADFRAMQGTMGEPGLDTMVQFHLATVDPQGNPTTGITNSTNDAWHMDEYTTPGYWEVLQWDPQRYLNVYTLNTVGYYGYYWGTPGSIEDGVYLWWKYVGDNSSPTAANDNYGRTATHEIGHYLGLHHTFEGGCNSSGCYSTGDLLCDTNAHASPTYGCPSNPQSCGNPIPVRNYMNYTDDNCMWEFTEEQARRMRCRVEWYRPNLAQIAPPLFTRYCDPSVLNSTLLPGMMDAMGSPVVADNDLTLRAYQLPINQFGVFLTSMTQANVPMAGGSIGTLCVGGNIGRFGAQQILAPGEFSLSLDLDALPMNPNQAAIPGETYLFQAWYRDFNPGAGSNFTDAISVLFQ